MATERDKDSLIESAPYSDQNKESHPLIQKLLAPSIVIISGIGFLAASGISQEIVQYPAKFYAGTALLVVGSIGLIYSFRSQPKANT